MNPTLETIFQRRSIRGYSPEQITVEQLKILLEAACASPSAKNTQPWHFSVVQNKALLDEFDVEYRRISGAAKDYSLFFGAPTVIFISTPIEAPSNFAQVDCGIAVQTIALAAQSIGLGSVILGRPKEVILDDPARFEAALKFPEGYKFAIAIAVGKPTTTKDAHPVKPNLITMVK